MNDGVTISTYEFLKRSRFRKACGNGNDALLSGIVEADETFLLESFKGKKNGCLGPPASALARRKNRGCPRNRFPCCSAGIGAGTPQMPSWRRSTGHAAFTAVVSRRAGLRCALSVSLTHFGADSHCHHNRRQSKSGVVIDTRKTQ
jgi:hypothetical protein